MGLFAGSDMHVSNREEIGFSIARQFLSVEGHISDKCVLNHRHRKMISFKLALRLRGCSFMAIDKDYAG